MVKRKRKRAVASSSVVMSGLWPGGVGWDDASLQPSRRMSWYVLGASHWHWQRWRGKHDLYVVHQVRRSQHHRHCLLVVLHRKSDLQSPVCHAGNDRHR